MSYIFLTFAFFNSTGALTMWLLLGPFYGQVSASGVASFGLVGMLRQVFSLSGTIVGGYLADQGRPYQRHFIVECLVFFLCFSLITIMIVDQGLGVGIIPYWVAVRFFLAGLSFVLGFRFIATCISSVGNSSIIHMMITQGATLFAPFVAILIPLFFEKFFLGSLIVDLISSVFYITYLGQKLGSDMDIKLEKSLNSKPFRPLTLLTLFWQKKFYPWNFFQFSMLLSVQGYFVFTYYLSHSQSWIKPEIFFPAMSTVYGVMLWVTGYLIKRSSNPKTFSLLGGGFIVMSGFPMVLYTSPTQLLFFFILYTVGFWLVLHSTNRLILERASEDSVGLLRSSMVFYLAMILGVGEYLYGNLFKSSNGLLILSYARSCIMLVGILFILFNLFRGVKYEKR